MSDPIQADAKPAARKSPLLRRALMAGAFALTFLAGGVIMSGAPTAAVAAMAMEHGMGHGGMGHGDMHAMMQGHIDKMLTEVNATADQKTRIHAILKTAMESMGPMHEKMAGAHSELHKILTAPTIDRAALERVRASMIGDLDQASKSMVQAIGDAAEVLTPEQRTKLGGLMDEHHHHAHADSHS